MASSSDSELFFWGYPRAQGRPGVRNYLLVLNITGLTNPAARKIAGGLLGAQLVSMPYGASVPPRGEEVAIRALAGLAKHPNVGAVLVLSADRGRSAALKSALADPGKPLAVVELADHDRDVLKFSYYALRVGVSLRREASKLRRQRFDWTNLCLAVECGLSDPSSGLSANPLIGDIVDRLVSHGGSAVFGETTEWLGSEQRLVDRAASEGVANALLNAVLRRELAAAESGIDLVGKNPTQANVEAGLSTIEDKAIGSIAKTGSVSIAGVLDYAESVGQGLFAMDGASYTPESLTGLVASGAQICLFSTGLGNSYVSAIAPTIKISGNSDVENALSEQIDFSAAEIITNPASRDSLATKLAHYLLEVASGSLTYGEILGEGDEVISRYGESL